MAALCGGRHPIPIPGFPPAPLHFPLKDATINGIKSPQPGKGGTAVKQAEEQKQAALAGKVARPLILGTTGVCALLTALAVVTAYPAARDGGWTLPLALGALAVFAAAEGTVLLLIRRVCRTYLTPLSDAVEAAVLAASGDLTAAVDRVPPTSCETEALLGAVHGLRQRSSECLLELERALNKMAAGDLTTQVACGRAAECGGVCGAMEEAAQKLRGAVGAVRNALEQLAGPLDYLERDAAGLSGDGQEKASWAALRQALERLTAHAEQRAGNAAEVSSAAEHMRRSLADCGKRQMELEQAVERANACAAAAGKIVKDMEAASFQCSVLARTAYVEAAGAGVNGKGFAIVACELRVLASRSAQAAQEAAVFLDEMRTAVREETGFAAAVSQELRGASTHSMEVCRRAAGAAQEAAQAKALQEAVRQAVRLDALAAENRGRASRVADTVQALNRRLNKLREALGAFRLQNR